MSAVVDDAESLIPSKASNLTKVPPLSIVAKTATVAAATGSVVHTIPVASNVKKCKVCCCKVSEE